MIGPVETEDVDNGGDAIMLDGWRGKRIGKRTFQEDWLCSHVGHAECQKGAKVEYPFLNLFLVAVLNSNCSVPQFSYCWPW
jgi:hypothetical protein